MFFLKIFSISLILPVFLFLLLSLFLLFFNQFKKKLSNETMISISAGILMSLTFLNFLPHSISETPQLYFSITILTVLVCLLLLETHLIPRLTFLNIFFSTSQKPIFNQCHQYHHHPFSNTSSYSAIGCLLICAFFDGFRISSGLLISDLTSSMTALAVLFHILPEGIAVLSLAKNSNLSNKSCLILQGIFCLTFALGILSTGWLNLYLSHGIILTISTATLIYITFIHLLPTSFKKENQIWFLLSLLFFSSISIVFKF